MLDSAFAFNDSSKHRFGSLSVERLDEKFTPKRILIKAKHFKGVNLFDLFVRHRL
jgi:hypothetical protein